jgi:copper chaperone
MPQITLIVTGMTCQGCVRSVKRVLEAQPGVQEAQVSLDRNEALVSYDPARVDPAQLTDAVRAAGYGAQPV